MNHAYLACLAFVAGGLLAAQAGFNALLAVLLRNALLAACAAFLTALTCVGLLYAVFSHELPARAELAQVPPYLWIVGGLFSALAVSSVYWLIPKMGISTVIACGLAGQLLTSLIAGHFGWFDLPVSPVNPTKILGATALFGGALLVTYG